MWGIKDIKRLALDWAEMGLSDTFGQYETRICGVYRVHPIIAFTHAGMATSTYSNFEQASKDFTTMSRVPFWNLLAEQLNAQLAIPDFGVQIGFDLSTVQALAGQAIASEAIGMTDDDISDDTPDNGDVQTLSLQPLKSEDRYALVPEAGLQWVPPEERQSLTGAQWQALQQALDDPVPFAALLRDCADLLGLLQRPLRHLLNYHCGVGAFRTRQMMLDIQTL